MRSALVTLADAEYERGARALSNSLEQNGNLPEGVEKIILTNSVKLDGWEQASPRWDVWAKVESRGRYRGAWSKLEIFGATFDSFDRIVFLDADMVCLGSIAELFDPDLFASGQTIAMSPDDGIGPPKNRNGARVHNSGMIVVNRAKTRLDVIRDLAEIGRAGLSYDGGDQGALHEAIARRMLSLLSLPQKFNVLKRLFKHQRQKWNSLLEDIRLLHFVGTKPWARIPEKGYGQLDDIWRLYE